MKKYKLSNFEKKVYRAILGIPLGQTRSYRWVAKKIGSPNAARAVGTALGKNPFAPLVPCHRIVKNDGTIGGYSGGAKKKKALLEKERVIKKTLAL